MVTEKCNILVLIIKTLRIKKLSVKLLSKLILSTSSVDESFLRILPTICSANGKDWEEPFCGCVFEVLTRIIMFLQSMIN
jgi:hypothetical protein